MKKILIVEDDQIVANIYRNKLSVEGFGVEVANDGNVGLDLADSFKPDAVILDLMLPKMTGVEFMKEVRSKPGMQNLPVIVFSNTYLTNMVQEAWKAGATKCLSKANCTPKQVIEVLRATLNITGATASAPATQSATPHAQQKPASGAKSTTVTISSPVTEIDFQNDLLKSFLQNLPATLTALRGQLQALIKADNNTVRLKLVHELYRRIHSLTGNAGAVGLTHIAQIADALEALLKELYEKPQTVSPSSLRTVASTIDFLGLLIDRGVEKSVDLSSANILVVDDEAISRRAVSHALEKAKLKATAVEQPAEALELLEKNAYDLIFLDIDMPGMNGFELCSRLRTISEHKKTPVVFVTSMNDFESRANSTMSGGNDFIAKPFLFMELAVKALTHILRARLAPVRRTAALAQMA